MVYNPARIATGYLKGLETGETRKIRGLNIERIKKEEAAKAKAAAKTERIEGLTAAYASGDTTAEQRLLQEGPAGLAEAQKVQEYQTAQTTRTRETQQFDREGSERELTQSLPRALTITDPAEWDQYEAWARPRSLAAGTSPEMYDQIANMPMAEAQNFLRTQMQGQKDPKAGNFKTYIDPEGNTHTMNMNNPEDVAMVESHKDDWRPAPSRQETAGAGGFGSDSEMKTVRGDILTSGDNTANLIAYVDDIQEIITENPDANALGGTLARIGGNLMADVKSTARLLGGDAQKDANRILIDNVGEYRGQLKEMGIANARTQSAIIGLAYQAALQANQRVTDADFKAALKEIGASHSDPEVFSTILDDYRDRAIGRYESMYTSRREMFGEKAQLGQMRQFDRSAGKRDFSTITLEELNTINPNSLSGAEREAAAEAWDRLNASN